MTCSACASTLRGLCYPFGLAKSACVRSIIPSLLYNFKGKRYFNANFAPKAESLDESPRPRAISAEIAFIPSVDHARGEEQSRVHDSGAQRSVVDQAGLRCLGHNNRESTKLPSATYEYSGVVKNGLGREEHDSALDRAWWREEFGDDAPRANVRSGQRATTSFRNSRIRAPTKKTESPSNSARSRVSSLNKNADRGQRFRTSSNQGPDVKTGVPSSGHDQSTRKPAVFTDAYRQNYPRETWQIQKQALSEKFGSTGWSPRKRLSPDALEGIRALHAQFPDKYTTPVLADQFEVSPEAIRRILKSKWRPNDEEEERRRARWDKRGENIWSQMVEMGIKPPKKWRDMGVGKSRDLLKSRHDEEHQEVFVDIQEPGLGRSSANTKRSVPYINTPSTVYTVDTVTPLADRIL